MPRGNNRIETTGLGVIGRIRRIFLCFDECISCFIWYESGDEFPQLICILGLEKLV